LVACVDTAVVKPPPLHDDFCGGCGGHSSYGGGRTCGRGDKKCDHCGGTNHIESYCWVEYGKLDYVYQIIDETAQSQPTATSFAHIPSGFDSHDALAIQLSELVQRLCTALPSSTTLANSSNVACVANSSPSWVIDSNANKHISCILFVFSDLIPVQHQFFLVDGSSRPVVGKGVLHPSILYPYHLVSTFQIFLLICFLLAN
jgi:hypothetical protein